MGTNRIRELNDAFRTTLKGGRVMVTSGVAELSDTLKSKVLMQVANFQDFTPANDPHGEHDFGSVMLVDQKFFWKIDYYDKEMMTKSSPLTKVSMEQGSEDPSDPEKTTRVLIIMLAEEY